MIRTTFKTLCFLLSNILLLLASCILGTIISSEKHTKYMYKDTSRHITYVLLLLNAGLCIFSFVIVQNLNDVFLHRIPSPRGVEMKMKIQWILLFVVMFFYGTFHSPLIIANWNWLLKMDVAILTTVVVFALQVSEEVIILGRQAFHDILNASGFIWNCTYESPSKIC